jgi:diguanylate cyclase (GGDEF)-like protein
LDFSIIMIDLDDFKSVNDTFGHQAGDIVLKKVAEIARALIRLGDRMGRWGGEEFIVLLPNASYEQAKELAERLRIGISIYHFDGVGSATASFGVSSFEREDDFYSLIQRADAALYRAKESGKNQVC